MPEHEDSHLIPTEPGAIPAGEEIHPPEALSDLDFANLLGAGAPPRRATTRTWEPPAVEDLQKALPQYEISAFVARGGMGAVYRGTQRSLKRAVAIKVLPPGLDDDDAGGMQFAERFKREAQAMARLSHPNIVAVHDAGETPDGLLYFVMEYIEGTDLAQLLASEGRLEPRRAIEITCAVCDALAFAHEEGIIHRDIKPSNVMIDRRGRVKVADFGLAKATNADASLLTASDATMGTPDFIAPEALRSGAAVDQRADLYAVGVMLYQMLTGQIPRGRFELPSGVVPHVDPRFDAIVDRAMQTDRDKRYSTATEMKQAVEKVVPGFCSPGAAVGTRVETTPRRGPKHMTTLLAAVLIAALGIGGWFLWNGRGQPAPGGARSSGTLLPDDAPASAPGGRVPPTPGTATKDTPFVNTLGMKFVPVPGTEVLFSIWHTRVRDYAAYAAVTKSVDGSWKTQQKDGVPVGREADHPVVGVSWEDAQAFCAWLTAKETAAGTLPRGAKYRLPTDAEWSTAVGLPTEPGATPEEKSGKNDVDFPWGRGWPPKGRAGNYADETFHAKFPPKKTGTDRRMQDETWLNGYTDGYATTSPVGSFPANAHGLYDLGGNVREWCEDWWNAEQKDRVLRGASWINYDRSYLLSSGRIRPAPGGRGGSYGFRCVLSAVSAQPPSDSTALSPAPSPQVSPSHIYPPGQWVKVFTKFDDLPDLVRKSDIVWRDGWFDGSGPAGSPVVVVPGARGRNLGIRCRGKLVVGENPAPFDFYLAVRRNEDTARGITDYRLSLRPGFNSLGITHSGKPPDLAADSLAPALQIGDEFSMELIAIGDKLHGEFNGKALPVATDTRLTNGGVGFQTKHVIRDIEVINLDGVSEAEARKAAGLEGK